jgi:hypothetical protein
MALTSAGRLRGSSLTSDPLEKIRIMSLDRYAANLVPTVLPGLIALASR